MNEDKLNHYCDVVINSSNLDAKEKAIVKITVTAYWNWWEVNFIVCISVNLLKWWAILLWNFWCTHDN